MASIAPQARIHVKKGDMVEVIGGKHRGKRGKILRVFPKSGQIIIEGVNMIKRHAKPTQKLPQGGIVEKEGRVFSGKVMFVCPKCGRAVRVGHGYLGDGTKVRICKHCGGQIEN